MQKISPAALNNSTSTFRRWINQVELTYQLAIPVHYILLTDHKISCSIIVVFVLYEHKGKIAAKRRNFFKGKNRREAAKIFDPQISAKPNSTPQILPPKFWGQNKHWLEAN